MALVDEPLAAIIARLLAVTAVTDLVGQRVAVFGDHASDANAGLPRITAQMLAGADANHLRGHPSAGGKADASVQLSCIGASYADAQGVRRAALAALRAWTLPAEINIGGTDTVRVQAVTVTDQGDAPTTPAAGRDAPRFVNQIDVGLWYSTG